MRSKILVGGFQRERLGYMMDDFGSDGWVDV